MQWLYTHWTYLTLTIVSLLCLALIDRRLKLLIWRSLTSRRATLAAIGSAVGFFLIWDIAGILLGIFNTNTRYTIGLNLFTPDLPIEEVFFLTLLSYSVLLLTRYFETHPSNAGKAKQVVRNKKP